MAPRPKTYGTRRSHAKQVVELVNGTAADEVDPEMNRSHATSTKISPREVNDIGTARQEEKPEIALQGPGKEDEPPSGTPIGGRSANSHTNDVKKRAKTLLPALRSLKNGKELAPGMLPPELSMKERDSRRTSIRRSANGSAISDNQDLATKTSFDPIPVDGAAPLQAKATLRPNGFSEEQNGCPISSDIDLKAVPSSLHNLAIWIAQLINQCSKTNASSGTNEPSKNDPGPQNGRNIEMNEAIENVEEARMTRGKERKRLQQMQGNEPASGLSTKSPIGLGKSLRSGDAAALKRWLKDKLNGRLKQELFRYPDTKDVSNNVAERNACGTLLFNTLVGIGSSADHNSAAVLKTALEERKDTSPFHSAIKVLASSSEIMSFINFILNNPPLREAVDADESRPSTTVGAPGATTMSETSGITNHGGTSITHAGGSLNTTTRNKRVDPKDLKKRMRSEEVIQALEAATVTLVKIQQREAGPDYIPSYATGSMNLNPVGPSQMTGYGVAYGLPHPEHPPYGMGYGSPVGLNFNNYAPPFTNPMPIHPNNYASPLVNPIPTNANSYASPYSDQNYASPYANPVHRNQVNGSGLVRGGDNQAKKHDGHESHRGDKEAYGPHQDIIGVALKTGKGTDGSGGQDVRTQDQNAHKATRRASDQDIDKGGQETSKACDEADSQAVSKNNQEASNAIYLGKKNVGEANKQNHGSDVVQKGSDDDFTDDDWKTNNHSVAPPSENHKLFTGERLGDFTTMENIDWLLTVGNGGKVPRPSKKIRMSSPDQSLSSPSSKTDVEVQTEVSMIVNQIMAYNGWRGDPGGTLKQSFYASAEGQRLAADLRRFMAIAKPVVNTIIPRAEAKARLAFYRQLEIRATREKRDREVQARYYGPPIQMPQWGPPPVGFPVPTFPIPPQLPSNVPAQAPVIRRGNVIAARPGGRNVEEEEKAETYGYPPLPGSRPGGSQRGQKRKSAARH